ncbi:MAG: DUF1501 domain-containing protein [Gemmataceae bacterium]
MNQADYLSRLIARRTFLARSGVGLGSLALASLVDPAAVWGKAGAAKGGAQVDRWPGVVRPLHHPAKAKRVIYLYMAGGMSHLETFDHKPTLAAMHGKPMPESFTKGQPIAQLQGAKLTCFAPQHPFKKVGKSGQVISDIFPHLQTVADELCIIHSLRTEAINHDPAHTYMNTGTTVSGRPSMGAWLWYGLGVDCDDLPGFVVLTSSGRYGQAQPISARQWHSGYLPSRFQGVHFRGKGDAVLYLTRPPGVSAERQRDVIDAVQTLNRQHEGLADDPEIATRVAQYEMAFRMQTSVPRLMDFKDEPHKVLDAYGTKGADGTFAANCLLARRLAERGVRFIQLYHRDWDHHGAIKDHIKGTAAEVDQPMAALIRDLKQRDLLKDTLVIFGSEFGRTPMAQGNGRDHHIKGFTMWMAGGGVKPGISYGATDELGYNAVEDVVEVNDMHATMLHLLGIDHKRLTTRFQGRDFRLTDIRGEIVHKILA